MKTAEKLPRWALSARCAVLCFLFACLPGVSAQQKRAMTFQDIVEFRSAGNAEVSPDGRRVLYTISVPDWKSGKSYTDISLSTIAGGASRQMTFTKEKNETAPRWSPDGKWFAFLSNRDGADQLYLMSPDGGEAHKLTEHKEAVRAHSFSKDGKYLAYIAGKNGETQIWLIALPDGTPVQLTKHATPVRATGGTGGFTGGASGGQLVWSPDSKSLFFVAPDSFDKADAQRMEKKFDVVIRDPDLPPSHLWSIDVTTKQEKRLTEGAQFTVGNFLLSPDGNHLGFAGQSPDRHENRLDQMHSDIYLLDLRNGKASRLTNNTIEEGGMSFSPDSRWFAFAASDDFQFFRNQRVYLTSVAGGALKKLGAEFDGDVRIGFWSKDSSTIYFPAGAGANNNLFALDTATGKVSPVTRETASVFASKDEDSDVVLINYSDPKTPPSIYAASVSSLSDRASWKLVVNPNPQIANLALGEYETVRWKSTDGQMAEGILIKPVGYEKGKRYPLIVQLHGGPASAVVNSFNASYGNYVHVFAGNGYAVFQPNYRASTNYGEKFKMQTRANYFPQAYDDIMTGVDYLIAQGIADPGKLGEMGWSAGGHWSNYILTQTNRFKAISSGAGVFNWVSMYGQTDTQENREWYIGGRVGAYPWDDLHLWLKQSPISYIKNARTPTLIHVGADDPRVPRPQSEELHMALKKLGVPTEFIVYPKMPHGLTEMRYQMVKMVSEFNWFEKWVKGKPGWFDWKPLLDSVGEEKPEQK